MVNPCASLPKITSAFDSSDPGSVSAGEPGSIRLDRNRRQLVSGVHPNYFSVYTAITTVDNNTVVVPAAAGLRIHITDMVVSSTTIGQFTLTNDAGTALFSASMAANIALGVSFTNPLVNETANDQVEFDKTAADDDWRVWLGGYYAP